MFCFKVINERYIAKQKAELKKVQKNKVLNTKHDDVYIATIDSVTNIG